MAGQVKVAVVSGAISSGAAGTADFTKSGFGTPKACIVLLSFDPTDNASVAAEGKASIGFSDFTNHRCITHQDEDGSAKVDCDTRKSATKAYVILNVGGAVDIDGTASTIADGVRLTNTTNGSGSAVFATVIMFGGADLEVSLDSVNVLATVDVSQTTVTTGFPPDLVFFIGVDIAGEDTTSTGINSSFGVVDISNDFATIINRCMGWASDHNDNEGIPSSVIRNNRALTMITEAGAQDWGIELNAATATSYTIITRDVSPGAGMEVYALALNLDDRGSKVGSVDSPISGATWSPSVSLGFTPQHVGLGLTHSQTEGVINNPSGGSGEAAGALGLSFNTGAGEEACHSWYNENLAATINANNLFRSRAIDLRDHNVSTVIQDHSHLSFDSGGWTYTINTENETIARKLFFWAIEVEAAGETPVSQTVISNYEALEGVPQTAVSPFETSLELAPTIISPYEALEEALQTNIPPFEALQGLSPIVVSPFEAAGTIIKALVKNYEASLDLISSTLSPYEALEGAEQTDVAVFKALGGIAATVVSNFEAAGTIIKALLKNYETSIDLISSAASPYEALEGLLKQTASPFEALEGLSSTTASPFEAAGTLIKTLTKNYEALAAPAASVVPPWESLQTALQAVVSPYEALAGVAPVVVIPYEAAGTVVKTLLKNYESQVSLAPSVISSWESLATALRSGVSVYESLINLAPVVTSSYAAAGVIVSITTSPYEARALAVGAQVVLTITRTLDHPNPLGRTLNYFVIITRNLEGD